MERESLRVKIAGTRRSAAAGERIGRQGDRTAAIKAVARLQAPSFS
jgi:hypothetical protein